MDHQRIECLQRLPDKAVQPAKQASPGIIVLAIIVLLGCETRAAAPTPAPLARCPNWVSSSAGGHLSTAVAVGRLNPERDACGDVLVGGVGWLALSTDHRNAAQRLQALRPAVCAVHTGKPVCGRERPALK